MESRWAFLGGAALLLQVHMRLKSPTKFQGVANLEEEVPVLYVSCHSIFSFFLSTIQAVHVPLIWDTLK